MEVIIAGYNKTSEGNLSPEIISASYARVSRDPRSIPTIREDAKLDVERARASNTNIVFGIGHSSIAEHVVFNIDIIGVSRFLVEEIESHRLVSYTEKSQRYVLFNGDYTIPSELNEKNKEEYKNLISEQNNFYFELYPILLEYFKSQNKEKYENEPKTVEGWAKEDARYIISLATQTQLGMTINARNLELMIRRLRACNYHEANELADKLYEQVVKITPSLFPYTTSSKLEIKNKEKTYEELNRFEMEMMAGNMNVYLLEYLPIPQADHMIPKISGVDNFSSESIRNYFLNIFREMEEYDSAPREFEFIDFQFILKMSASCFAQLKRHRMMSIIPKSYQITKDVIIPKSVKETKMSEKFLDIIDKTNKFYKKTETPYCLTNAHTRFVYVKISLREMYHFCRMRQDLHAQWEIRELANSMNKIVSIVCPKGMMLCCGKHEFKEVYDKIFS